MNNSAAVAVVDDDTAILESFDTLFRSAGMPARFFSSAEEFLSSGAAAQSTCLVLDVDMPGMTGPELFKELLKRGHFLPVIFMTGRVNERLRTQMLEKGATAFLHKPFDVEELIARVEEAARCFAVKGNHPHGEGWCRRVLFRRGISNPEEISFYMVFALRTATLKEAVEAAGSRWRIEECFESAKGEVGLDHYEVRSWTGWHRHITLAMIAHAALVISRAKVFPAPEAAAPGGRKKRSSLAAYKKRQRQWSR